MKKFLFITFVLVLLFAVAQRANTYKMQGRVIANDTVQDEAGYVWEYDTNDFRVGDNIEITFQERGTTSRADDIIRGIKK